MLSPYHGDNYPCDMINPVRRFQEIAADCKTMAGPAMGVVLACLMLVVPVATRADSLSVDRSAVVDELVASDLFVSGDFELIDDPYIGPLEVGRPAEGKSAVSVLLIPGDDAAETGQLSQIQFILAAPFGDLVTRVEMVAGVLDEVIGPPPVFTEPLSEDPALASMSPTAKWLYGLMTESWLGWPGSSQRLVRVRDGIAVIVEGVPPEIWGITIVVDEGEPDVTWPGFAADLDPPGVTDARLLIRQGEYQEAYDLLLPLAEAAVPQASNLLGDMYRFGRLDVLDMDTAADWYLIGGRFQFMPSVWSLASMSNEGWGIFFVSNFKAPLIVQAAKVGSADALYLLAGTDAGVNYVRPEGVSATDQITGAARWGLLGAQQDMAMRYATANGVDGDAVEAYAWALVALANTDPGLDYIRSHQLEQDLRKGLSDEDVAAAQARSQELVTGPPPWPPAGMDVPALQD
ncbi:MAG: sel1 repeat family protein [Rhodospirillaceae bacterium]|nr:sel1 repeat family protein [Rhodospirillaceae bacterium]